jgi:lipoprotein-releasing system permease protein
VADVPFELHVALRYLLAKRKQAFISVISSISTLGVAVGVMAVIIALAVMTGLQQELRQRLLGSQPHIFVSKVTDITDYHAEIDKLMKVPGVAGAAPAIIGKAMLQSGGGAEEFIQLNGIDPALESNVIGLAGAITSGSLAALAPQAPAQTPATDESGGAARQGILLGSELAASLGVVPGDPVRILTAEGTLSPMGMQPHQRTMRVAGVFSLGLSEVDSTFAFVSLETAESLLDRDTVEFIQLRVANLWDAPAIAANIRATFGPDYRTEDWSSMNRSLFSALSLEKIAVSLAIGLIVMVAALNIVASLILLVMEKHRDIAILKTMGASARSVMTIFVAQGLIIGLIGTAAGAAGGVGVSMLLDRYKLIRVPADVYQVSYLPFIVLWQDFALVVAVAVLICLVATIYPSRQAARLDPAQALRYE